MMEMGTENDSIVSAVANSVEIAVLCVGCLLTPEDDGLAVNLDLGLALNHCRHKNPRLEGSFPQSFDPGLIFDLDVGYNLKIELETELPFGLIEDFCDHPKQWIGLPDNDIAIDNLKAKLFKKLFFLFSNRLHKPTR